MVVAEPAHAELSPLIPRDVLFGNPVKAQPRLSPDGTHLSYLAPSAQGVMNVWVQTLGKDDPRMVTHATKRGIRIHRWAANSRQILYAQDVRGDENWHVYAVDFKSKRGSDLTPFEGVRAENILSDWEYPEELLVGLNRRDRRVFDMYRVALRSGNIELDTKNPGNVKQWLADADFQIRGAVAHESRDGSKQLLVRTNPVAPWRDLIEWPFGETGKAHAFTEDGTAVAVETSLGSNTTRLVLIELATGKKLKTLAHDRKADVGAVLIDPNQHHVQAVAFEYLKPKWVVLDEAIRDDVTYLAKLHRGGFSVTSRTQADDRWIVAYEVDNGPTSYYLYDRPAKKATFLFHDRPALEHYPLAEMKPVILKARDGLELVAYLTLPVGMAPKKLPLVLLVHGGPWQRDTWGYDPRAQWLANRGYAVLQVNFRGSTGFGKAFHNAGNGQWGVGSMQHDLTDAVRWAINEGIADPQRICIFGRSYGGYATLAGLVFTPALYTCGVDMMGPSHIKTLFQSIPPYWAPLKKELILRVGNVEEDEALNRRISPLFHVDNLRVPLLVAQGANDPRVNIRESDQIVQALRARDLPVTYVIYTDEGHTLARPENRLDFYGRAEAFLANHLGGRAEPWKKIAGANAEVR